MVREFLFRLKSSFTKTNISSFCLGAGVLLVGAFGNALHVPLAIQPYLAWLGIGLIGLGLVITVLKYRNSPYEKIVKVITPKRIKHKGALTNLKNTVIEVSNKIEDLLNDVKMFSPAEYIETYYQNDETFQSLVSRYTDETEALLILLIILPVNPKLQDKLKESPLRENKQTMNSLCMTIGDDKLRACVDEYWKKLSEFGAQWISSYLTDKFGKKSKNTPILDARYYSVKTNEFRLDAIKIYSWQIVKRIDYLLNGG